MADEPPSQNCESERQIAEVVREACVDEALRNYKDAQMRGLCAEGAWEVAIGAVRTLDLERVLRDASENGTFEQK